MYFYLRRNNLCVQQHYFPVLAHGFVQDLGKICGIPQDFISLGLTSVVCLNKGLSSCQLRRCLGVSSRFLVIQNKEENIAISGLLCSARVARLYKSIIQAKLRDIDTTSRDTRLDVFNTHLISGLVQSI